MKIEVKNEKNLETFLNIAIGDVFRYDNKYFLKVDNECNCSVEDGEGGQCCRDNVVNLLTGTKEYFELNGCVEIVEAKLVVG